MTMSTMKAMTSISQMELMSPKATSFWMVTDIVLTGTEKREYLI